MGRQQIHSRKSYVVKCALLLLLIVFIVYLTPTAFKARKESPAPIRLVNHDFRQDRATVDIDKVHRSDGTGYNAKLFLNPILPRKLALQNQAAFDECLRKNGLILECNKLDHPAPAPISLQLSPHVESYWVQKLSRAIKSKYLAPRSGVVCSIMGIIWEECAGFGDDSKEEQALDEHSSSSTATSCYTVFGVTWFCDRLQVEGSHDREYSEADGHPHSKTSDTHPTRSLSEQIHATNSKIRPRSANPPNICKGWPSHSSSASAEAVSASDQTGRLFSRLQEDIDANAREWCSTLSSCYTKRSKTPGYSSDTGSETPFSFDEHANQVTGSQLVPRRGRLHQCKLNPKARGCRRPSSGKATFTPDPTKNLVAGSAILPRQESFILTSKATKGEYHIDHLQYPSKKEKVINRNRYPNWSRNTANLTVDCAHRTPYFGPTRTLKERMDDPCTKQSHILRTWIDDWLPPKECEPFDGAQFKKCLKVSKEQSPITITIYTILGISTTCGVALLLMTILRLRRRREVPVLNDSKRSSGTTTPNYTAETRGIGGNGPVVRGASRGNGDLECQESRNQPSTTLDGANDGWTQWILKKSRGEVRRIYSPTLRTCAPRIPSLNLPKPSFATMRKASGLDIDPETIPGGKSRKQKSGPRVNWGSTV